MASRDLTNFFIRSRSLFHRPKASFAGGGGEGGGQDLLGSSADASVDFSSLSLSGASPVYVETVNELQTDLGSITTRRECRRCCCLLVQLAPSRPASHHPAPLSPPPALAAQSRA
jgi:hypothetical protein